MTGHSCCLNVHKTKFTRGIQSSGAKTKPKARKRQLRTLRHPAGTLCAYCIRRFYAHPRVGTPHLRKFPAFDRTGRGVLARALLVFLFIHLFVFCLICVPNSDDSCEQCKHRLRDSKTFFNCTICEKPNQISHVDIGKQYCILAPQLSICEDYCQKQSKIDNLYVTDTCAYFYGRSTRCCVLAIFFLAQLSLRYTNN